MYIETVHGIYALLEVKGVVLISVAGRGAYNGNLGFAFSRFKLRKGRILAAAS